MSNIFTVVLDLSRVKNDNKGNQLYLAMADTTKMGKIYEFKQYIQFLFSLGCAVELYHGDVRLPDLEDIRVLLHLDVVQVRPENLEEEKEGNKLISKSKGYNENYGDKGPRPVPGDSVSNCNYIDSKENVCNYKSLELGKITQVQEVSGFGDHGKAEMSCSPLFPAGNRACSTVQKPKDNMMGNMCDIQEDKTFRLEEKTGMVENLKLAALLQSRYFEWGGKPDSNISTGRSHSQKSNEMPDLKLGEEACSFKNSGKFTDNNDGMENKSYIGNEGDVNISKNTFKGNIWSPVKLKEKNNHELCDTKSHAHQITSKSCSRSVPNPHSVPYSSHVVPGTLQKPLTSVTADYCENNSCAKGSFIRKPLTVDEALKILTETAAERSKALSSNNSAFHNNRSKNQFKGVYKTFKANPFGGSKNHQKGNVKHQTTSKTPAMLDKDGTAMAVPLIHTPKAVSYQPHVPKQDMKKNKVYKKTESGDKNQGNALLKGCEKHCENQNKKTGNTGKFEAKTGAQNKNMCKANNPTETGDKFQGKKSLKGCEKIDGNQGGKTESTGKVEAKTGATNPLTCHPTEKKKRLKKKKKAMSENKSVTHSLISDCEPCDSNHSSKIGVAGKTETETAPSNDLIKYGDVKNKMAPGDDLGKFSDFGSVFLQECLRSPVLNDIVKGKAFNGGESAGFEKSPSSPPGVTPSRGDSEPGVRLHCSSPDNPTGVHTSSKNTRDFQFPGKDARPNLRSDLLRADPVNTEDGDGTNVTSSSANSFSDLYRSDEAVVQDAAVYPFNPEGKTICDGTSSKDDNKDNSESRGSPVTNKVITRPDTITDNTSATEYTKDVNVSGDGGEGRPVSSQGQADLTRNHSRVGFGTGSAGVGGTDSASSGSRSIPTDEVITPPLRIVEIVKTEESQDLHGPEGSSPDTKVGQVLSSRAGAGTGNGSRSGTGKKECLIC